MKLKIAPAASIVDNLDDRSIVKLLRVARKTAKRRSQLAPKKRS